MEIHPLLQPVVVLLAWTAVMFLWMYALRIPAMMKAGIDLKNRVGGRGSDLDKVLPAQVQWKAHNYNHLMEQPTLFYAVVLTLVLAGSESRIALIAAWAYVGFRILHSLVQAISNRIRLRFPIFMLASIALIVLIGVAICTVF